MYSLIVSLLSCWGIHIGFDSYHCPRSALFCPLFRIITLCYRFLDCFMWGMVGFRTLKSYWRFGFSTLTCFCCYIFAILYRFEKQDGVVLMATTRNLKQVDEALQRPGRMDRIFNLQRPTQTEREKILHNAARVTMDEDLIDFVDWRKVLRITSNRLPFWFCSIYFKIYPLLIVVLSDTHHIIILLALLVLGFLV